MCVESWSGVVLDNVMRVPVGAGPPDADAGHGPPLKPTTYSDDSPPVATRENYHKAPPSGSGIDDIVAG